jgi:hypothetical protein
MTKYFPGKDHSEKSWKERLNIPLEFFIKNKEIKKPFFRMAFKK